MYRHQEETPIRIRHKQHMSCGSSRQTSIMAKFPTRIKSNIIRTERISITMIRSTVLYGRRGNGHGFDRKCDRWVRPSFRQALTPYSNGEYSTSLFILTRFWTECWLFFHTLPSCVLRASELLPQFASNKMVTVEIQQDMTACARSGSTVLYCIRAGRNRT